MTTQYTMNLDGAADMDSDVCAGTLSSKERARSMVHVARSHGADVRLMGDVVSVLDEGTTRRITTMVALMEYLGY